MLNDTQITLLNEYINDYFIEGTKSLIESADSIEEETKSVEIVTNALTQPNLDFCTLVLKTYSPEYSDNKQKIALLVTLNSIANALNCNVKWIKTVLDFKISSSQPVDLTPAEWQAKRLQFIAEHVKTKMLGWLTTREEKPKLESSEKTKSLT